MEKAKKYTVYLKVIGLTVVAALSFFWAAPYVSSPETYKATIGTLDEKKDTVMALSAAATAASVMVSAIPGDAATPIANELADLSTMFLLVLAALYLEKYLLTIVGYGFATLIVPAVCALWIVYELKKDDRIKTFSLKLLAFGLVLFIAVPGSVRIANMIDETYKESISTTVESANNAAEDIDQAKDDKGIFDSIVSGITDGITGSLTYLKNLLSKFIEAVAVMIVTSCMIPIAVFAFLAWFINFLFGININLPKIPRRSALAAAKKEALPAGEE